MSSSSPSFFNQSINNGLFGIKINPNLGTPVSLYQSFSNSGPIWQIILPSTLLFIISIISIILNLFVIIITILTLTLRGTANYLMALICFCEVLHASGHLIFFIISITGINFIPLLIANLLIIHMIFGLYTCMPLMLSAGFDRLFAVSFPQLHKSICIEYKYIYLSIYTIFCIFCGFYGVYYVTEYSFNNPNIPTTGCITEILFGNATEYYIYSAIFNSLTVLSYVFIYAIVRCKKGVSEETNTRLLRSLVCIMVISIGGYIINLTVYQILFKMFDRDSIILWQLGFIPGILLNIGSGSNAVILYFTSSEYRKAFKYHLNKLATAFGIKGTNTVSALYEAFANDGQTINLIIPAFSFFIISIISIILNLFVIIITILTLTLRGTANYLMALICFCEVLHASGHLIFFIISITGINFIPLLIANLLIIHMIFGLYTCMPLMLSAGFDRLFAVSFPQLHKSICIEYKYIYLSIYTIFCIFCGFYGVYYVTEYSFNNPNIPTTGCISEIISGQVGTQFFIYSSILNLLTALCYILIWIIIRCKKGVLISEQTNTRLLRSLICIMFISIGGYIINLTLYQIIFQLSVHKIFNSIILWQLGFIPGILLNIGAGSNAVILYFTSSEYRKAFKYHLNKMAKVFGIKGTNTVTVVSPMFATSSQKISKVGNNY
ncbi:hypothetical protein Mgra_00001087 [Meloidogyne graminicola]|uniref:G-protein coupled receptors family 1 profile domain-containing protein n=1 Tax=Meloidogyne graminicola TaxID=189291 RepID=A0A8T0A201_9BILA|nr:hypothetical protein Mgra_00001087 [Meloidogyne graminicola]